VFREGNTAKELMESQLPKEREGYVPAPDAVRYIFIAFAISSKNLKKKR
jgi:hypothetical protein